MNSDDKISVRNFVNPTVLACARPRCWWGLSPSELSRVENGERRLSGAARMRMINAFDLKAADVRRIAELDPYNERTPA